MVIQVQSLLDMGQVVSAGPFLYAFLPEGTPETKFFAHPNCLSMLARFALEAYVKMVSRVCDFLLFFVVEIISSLKKGEWKSLYNHVVQYQVYCKIKIQL